MLKVNELKNLRTTENMNSDEDNVNVMENNIDHEEEQNMSKGMNMSNNSNNNSMSISKQNKNTQRIEIDANTNEENNSNKKKIFMTDYNLLNFDNKDLFSFHDMIVPGGKNAKLCMINDPFNKNLRATEIADHFKFYEPTPVIVLIGANTKQKGKLFAGLTRAALNTKAIIIDSGLHTGLEKFCIRKNLNLIGIAPESIIEFPKPNPEKFSNKMLTSGHTHFILLGSGEGSKYKLNWGDEYKFKLSFAERLANGRKGFPYKSKVVGIIVGNIPNCEEEIGYFVDKNWPLILIEDSEISQAIKTVRSGERPEDYNNEAAMENKTKLINKISKYSKVIEIDDDSENLASATHLCLTISF